MTHDQIIRRAIRILEERAQYNEGKFFKNPEAVKEFCYLRLANQPDENFAVLFLTNRHQLIKFDTVFTGTIDGASVYPRVVVRKALEHNAAAVIFAHNHPSGIAEPSQADIRITQRLKDALDLVDVRVLDHIVVGATVASSVSFAERGLI